MKEENIYRILTWIFLIIGIIMILWYIFGNSPYEILMIVPWLATIYTKMSSMELRLTERITKNEIKINYLTNDFKNNTESYHTRGKRK